jgi:hypothetical protein
VTTVVEAEAEAEPTLELQDKVDWVVVVLLL